MGTRVRIPKNELTEFDLPRVCVITGETKDVAFFDVNFQFIPKHAVKERRAPGRDELDDQIDAELEA